MLLIKCSTNILRLSPWKWAGNDIKWYQSFWFSMKPSKKTLRKLVSRKYIHNILFLTGLNTQITGWISWRMLMIFIANRFDKIRAKLLLCILGWRKEIDVKTDTFTPQIPVRIYIYIYIYMRSGIDHHCKCWRLGNRRCQAVIMIMFKIYYTVEYLLKFHQLSMIVKYICTGQRISVKWSAILSLPVNHMCHFVLCCRNSVLLVWTCSGLKKVHFVSELNLNCNKLTSLPQLCPLKCCLVNLLIAHNNITTLSKNFFNGFKKLNNINMTNNNLIVLPDLHWIKHSVFFVDASKTKIESLDALNTPSIYKRLQTIDVGFNAIRTFNISLLHHMPKLRYFNLIGNILNHIDDFRSVYIMDINLRNNPWHCGAELSWMGEQDMDFKRGLICATPTCLHGMAIGEMSKYVLLYIDQTVRVYFCFVSLKITYINI